MDFPAESDHLQELEHGIESPHSEDLDHVEEQRNTHLWTYECNAWTCKGKEQEGQLSTQCIVPFLEDPGNENREESKASTCSDSVIHEDPIAVVISQESLSHGQECQEEPTPEKAMVENVGQDGRETDQIESGIELDYVSDGSENFDNKAMKLSHSFEKNNVVGDLASAKVEYLQVEEASLRLQGQAWQDSKTNASLVRALCRQIESLSLKEKEAEQLLNRERIEHLVSKVEEEVEFEGLVEDMCLKFRAEGEFMDMERREREWARERQEVQLEEEVGLLRSKVQSLEEELRMANAEKEYALQKKQDEIDDLLSNIQAQSQGVQREQAFGILDETQIDEDKMLAVVRTRRLEQLDEAGENMLAALQEMLCSAEEMAERDRRALEELEDSFRNEHQRWDAIEQQLENQVYELEKDLNIMRETLKEKESIISLEKERRRQYGLEVDKVLAFWREESLVHKKVYHRLKNLEDFFTAFKKKAIQWRTVHLIEGTKAELAVSELFRELEKLECGNEEVVVNASDSQLSFDWELIERWKAQRDNLEAERNKLEEKLDLAMMKARDNEKRIESAWQEKERNLVEKLRNLEVRFENEEIARNRKNAVFLQEKRIWQLEIDAYRKDWEEEREKVLAIMVDREQWIEGQTKEWARLLDIKEEELCASRSLQKKLVDTLSTSKRRLITIKKQLIRSRKNNSKGSRPIMNEDFDDKADWCTGDSELETSSSTEFVTMKETQGSDGAEDKYCVDAEELAADLAKELGKLAKEIRLEQERLERERTEVRIGTDQLKEERKVLEEKVADALSLMEGLKVQIRAKEGRMELEQKQMQSILSAKVDEIENLKVLLSSKEHEIEFNVQKFKDEMNLIEKEVEKERKEREEVMALHFASRKKLIKEIKEKEARWEKEIEVMTLEMQRLRGDIDEKEQDIVKLKKQMNGFKSQTRGESPVTQQEQEVTSGVFICENNESQYSTDEKQMYVSKEQGLTNSVKHEMHLESGENESNENHAVTNIVRSDGDIAGLHNSDSQTFIDRRDIEWQDAIEKIASFDKQIAEAMLAIESLKEELSVKEKELQRARLERNSDCRAAWLDEQDQMKELQEQRRLFEVQREFDWGEREQALLREKEELLKLLEAERADTADAMSILQGAVRELQWALKHEKQRGDDDIISELDRETTLETPKFSTKGDLVKVHTSHLQDMDRLILDLKLKVEETEKRARAAEVALAVNAVKEAAKNSEKASALVKVGKDWSDFNRTRLTAMDQDELVPSFIGKDYIEGDFGGQGFQSPSKRYLKSGRGPGKGIDGNTNLAGKSLSKLQHEQSWPGGITEHGRLWGAGVSGPGGYGESNSSSSSWMTVRAPLDDSYGMRDSFQKGSLTLAVSTPPPRSQRKWLVDASWIENVRKEQSSLRRQLELEQQRASALGQVEAENRWMEATIMQALEEKRESDTKILELEQKVAFLEAMIANRGGMERSPSSSSFYRSTRGKNHG